MTQLRTPMLAIDKIEIEEGFNVRKKMDKAKLERMAGSIEKHELVQPIAVRKGKGGKYIVVDGHRRVAAATLAGEKEVPITISGAKNPKLAALLANMHREDLNDIETAEAIKELAAEEGWKTNTEIADELDSISASWVGQLLRLLNLPPGVQKLIASGEVPTKAERLLKPIAKVSPRIAECVCELAKREKVEPGDFVRLFPELLTKVPFEETEDAKFALGF
jgi:ParB family chromosome partitioning protein